MTRYVCLCAHRQMIEIVWQHLFKGLSVRHVSFVVTWLIHHQHNPFISRWYVTCTRWRWCVRCIDMWDALICDMHALETWTWRRWHAGLAVGMTWRHCHVCMHSRHASHISTRCSACQYMADIACDSWTRHEGDIDEGNIDEGDICMQCQRDMNET